MLNFPVQPVILLQAWFLNSLLKWMSQRIQLAENHQIDKEKMETNTWGGANAVASFEEYGINLESILEFKVSFGKEAREKCRCYVMYS
jgi:hypothetical protein